MALSEKAIIAAATITGVSVVGGVVATFYTLRKRCQLLESELSKLQDEVTYIKRMTSCRVSPVNGRSRHSSATFPVVDGNESDDDYVDAIATIASPLQEFDLDSINSLLESGNPTDLEYAFNCLSEHSKLYKRAEDIPALTLIAKAKATFLKSELVADAVAKKTMRYRSKSLAELALAKERCFEVLKWSAVALGATIEYHSLKEQVRLGREFQLLVEEALRLNSSDGWCHFLLGRYRHAAYSLTWYERSIAKTVFGTVPTATLDECIESFTQADAHIADQDGKKELYMYLAKCYVDRRDYPVVSKYLRLAENAPIKSTDDHAIHQEVLKMIKACPLQ